MITEGGRAAGTPAALLRQTPTSDDAGAATADRYEWQAMMATIDVLAAYLQRIEESGTLNEGNPFTVICELHEDWALLDGDAVEIVSAKHKETSVPRLGTLRSLLDCGVLHLFERWEALGRTPICRLVTTAGVADEAAKLTKASEMLRESQDIEADGLDTLLSALGAVIGSMVSDTDTSIATIALFLGSLRIQHSQPHRDHLPDMAPTRYAKPIAARLGRPGAAEAIWTAVLGLVRERMRAAGPTLTGALPTVLGVPLDDDPHATRSLTLMDVDVAVRVALRNVAGYARLPRRARTTRMAVKMLHGGCSDNTIERVESLRLQHQRHWRDQGGTPTTRNRRRRLDNVLLKVVSEVTESVRADDGDWGVPLLTEVEARLRVIADGSEVQGLDADLLLGGVADLSNNCKVWFTDRFDIAAEIARLTAEAAS